MPPGGSLRRGAVTAPLRTRRSPHQPRQPQVLVGGPQFPREDAMSTSGKGDAGQDAALRLLADLLGAADLRVVGETHEVLPDGRALRRVWGVSAAEPNNTASVVVDAEGIPIDQGELGASIGRRPF